LRNVVPDVKQKSAPILFVKLVELPTELKDKPPRINELADVAKVGRRKDEK
jgi:hypothetical protein